MTKPRALGVALAVASMVTVTVADAATWTGGRTTPSLRELVAVDATGETSWIYGQEDVAGDGLDNFKPQEQSIDVRTAYAATDAASFWVRAYVSDGNAVGGNVVVFVFIDADANPATGGKAAATDINALLTTDPSPGGYEFCIGMRGNGALEGVWQFRQANGRWDLLPPNQGNRTPESGTDVDPIRIAVDGHGYVQAKVDHSLVGLSAACGGNLFFRSVNTAQGIGNGDLDVGKVGPCIPADGNGDKIPDVLVPPTACTVDTQCPERGVCVDGKCIIAPPCVTNTDCPSGLVCTSDGRCVAAGGGACTSDAQCDGLLCINGKCTPCTPGGTECGAGRRCAPDGKCIAGAATGGGSSSGASGDGGIALAPGDRVVGGAFNCNTGGGAGSAELALGACAVAVALGAVKRRKKKVDTGR